MSNCIFKKKSKTSKTEKLISMKGTLTFSKARATLKMMFRPWEKNEKKKKIYVQLKENIELNSLLTYSQLNNHMKELLSKTTTCFIPRKLSQTLNLNDKNYQTYFFRIQCKCH